MEITRLEEEILRENFKTNGEYYSAVKRLENGEPLAYIIGKWYFFGLEFALDGSTLIPRPDTEHLVDFLIKRLPKNSELIDLGTGSGCIAIATLVNRKDVSATLVDISEKALDRAKENALLNCVIDRCKFIQCDILDGIPSGEYDAVVSNPPYIRSEVIETLQDSVKNYEPRTALDGGADGLVFYRSIIKNAPQYIKKGGFLLFEIGYDQKNEIEKLANEYKYACNVYRDYGGNDRMAVFEI
ncbi:MAG: peptide chain release factor N(5)-glutamine methyltransferase [Clostridia bacterium]|nr:peptide chain release factor N(5)-glutamine methyltransferase [Clostridia bacterium]